MRDLYQPLPLIYAFVACGTASIMRKFIYKSGRIQSAQGKETCP